MPLYFITGNTGKFNEVKAVLPRIEQLKLHVDEIQSLDPKQVIEHKLAQAAASYDGEFIVEDTSVVFNCIAPLPGTLIKWFEEGMGIDAVAELVNRFDDHSAVVLTTIGYRDAGGSVFYCSGEYTGRIVERRGAGGFGFDPIFQADGQTKTNAELTPAEKNTFSARGKAARRLAEHLADPAIS